MSLRSKIKTICISESGRSMVEMLGVLAIIGVLSIAGIAGYKFALNKFRANETINELNMRALSLSTQLTNGNLNQEELSTLCDTDLNDGFSEKTGLGYEVNAYLGCPGMRHFEVYVQGVDSEVCRLLMRDYTMPLCIITGERTDGMNWESCLIDESQCGDNQTVDMAFIYNNDLINGERSCPARAEFNPSDYRCYCGGGTYVKNGECECPAGFMWDAEENSCYPSPCDKNYFKSINGTCISCNEVSSYKIATDEESKELCAKCESTPRRWYKGYSSQMYCVNAKENSCVEGETFLGALGKCYDCKTKLGISINANDPETKALCESEKCGRQIVYGYYNYAYCIRPDMCELGSQFVYDNAGSSGHLECRSCDVDANLSGKSEIFKTTCEACQENGVSNRVYNALQNPTCVRSGCASGEFKGSDNQCYNCQTTQKAISVASGDITCTAELCGREIINGKCRLKECPSGTHVRTDDGSCYDCSQKAYFNATAEQCDSCTSVLRSLLTGSTSGKCARDDTCNKGSQFPYNGGASCYTCGDWHPTGTTALAHEYCIALGGHIVGSYCVCNKACTSGEKFIDSVGGCHVCTTSEAIEISTMSVDRTHCTACTTARRFWVGEYCYPCDTIDSPNVFDDEEIAQCQSCGDIRKVQDGKCVLVTAS